MRNPRNPFNPLINNEGDKHWDDVLKCARTIKHRQDFIDWSVAYFVPIWVLRLYRNWKYR